MMTAQDLKEYCLAKLGTTFDFPFDDKTVTYRVGNKIYALSDITSTPLRVNLKCDPDLARELREQYSGITPGYHMNKTHWNTIIDDGSLPDDKIKWLIDHSYDIIFAKLPLKIRKEIDD